MLSPDNIKHDHTLIATSILSVSGQRLAHSARYTLPKAPSPSSHFKTMSFLLMCWTPAKYKEIITLTWNKLNQHTENLSLWDCETLTHVFIFDDATEVLRILYKTGQARIQRAIVWRQRTCTEVHEAKRYGQIILST